jgi:hypothetical protein
VHHDAVAELEDVQRVGRVREEHEREREERELREPVVGLGGVLVGRRRRAGPGRAGRSGEADPAAVAGGMEARRPTECVGGGEGVAGSGEVGVGARGGEDLGEESHWGWRGSFPRWRW